MILFLNRSWNVVTRVDGNALKVSRFDGSERRGDPLDSQPPICPQKIQVF